MKAVASKAQTSWVQRTLPAWVLAAGLGLGMLPGVAQANNPPPAVRADAPNVYVVKKGDTLWDIARHYLRSPWRWPEIWATNPQVKNPHLIYPGDRLLLCSIGGRQVVGVDQGDGCEGVVRRITTGGGDARLSARIRVEPLDSAVPAIPLSEIRSWLTQATVMDYATLHNAPYVLAARERHVITAAGDIIYVRSKALNVGDVYGVYRQGERYADPETQETLGYEMRQVARGLVIEQNGEVASVRLTDSFQQEVREGDLVLPEQGEAYPPIFYPTNAKNILPGRLIRVMDSVGTAGNNSVIAINRGAREGVQPGQVLAIHQRGALVLDPKRRDSVRLPSERAGLVMVFRSFEKMSYAYVLEAAAPLKVGDEVRPPIDSE